MQGIWDALATQWADTQAVHERMFGFKPQGVEPRPLVLTDLTGNAVTLPGGYYPVRYDPNVSDRVANWNEKEDLMARNEAMFAVPAARRGHTQAAPSTLPGLPLRLDTGIIMEHINDAVRFIELGEIVRPGGTGSPRIPPSARSMPASTAGGITTPSVPTCAAWCAWSRSPKAIGWLPSPTP